MDNFWSSANVFIFLAHILVLPTPFYLYRPPVNPVVYFRYRYNDFIAVFSALCPSK